MELCRSLAIDTVIKMYIHDMVGIKPKIDGDNAGMFGFCRCIFIVAWLPAAIQYNNVITSTEIYF